LNKEKEIFFGDEYEFLMIMTQIKEVKIPKKFNRILMKKILPFFIAQREFK